jgi:DNA-binding response OmpR family regulator
MDSGARTRADVLERLALARGELQRQSDRLADLLERCRRTQSSCLSSGVDRATANRLFAADTVLLGTVEVVLQRQAIRDGRSTRRLTPTEWQLLLFLLASPGTVHSRADLAAGAWGAGYHGRNSEVEVYVSRLRRKLGSAGRLLETVRGEGYRLVANDPAPARVLSLPARRSAIA